MDDEVYKLTFNRLNDLVKGMGGSNFQSSAWVPRFVNALKAHPVLEQDQVGFLATGQDHCDACNRSGHPATWSVRFTGPEYNLDSLEEYSDDDDEDEDGSSRLPVFAVGK